MANASRQILTQTRYNHASYKIRSKMAPPHRTGRSVGPPFSFFQEGIATLRKHTHSIELPKLKLT